MHPAEVMRAVKVFGDASLLGFREHVDLVGDVERALLFARDVFKELLTDAGFGFKEGNISIVETNNGPVLSFHDWTFIAPGAE